MSIYEVANEVLKEFVGEPINDMILRDAVVKAIKQGYKDGYEAAINAADSVQVKVGDETVDKMFGSNRNTVVTIMRSGYERMKFD